MQDALLDGLPEHAAEDTNTLLGAVGPFAQQMLEKNRGFHPFGAAIGRDGELTLLGAENDQTRTADELYGFLLESLRAERGAWRSGCLAVDTTHPEFGDTVVFTLDFTEGAHGLVALMPYRPGGLWRATRFEDLRVGTAPSVIWGERRDDPVL